MANMYVYIYILYISIYIYPANSNDGDAECNAQLASRCSPCLVASCALHSASPSLLLAEKENTTDTMTDFESSSQSVPGPVRRANGAARDLSSPSPSAGFLRDVPWVSRE